MGRLHQVHLEGNVIACADCQTHLTLCEEIISTDFRCRSGKAYLFNIVVNAWAGKIEERMMTTGMHTVADIFCVGCGSLLGWKYVAAEEIGQRYKIGKVILEKAKLTGPSGPFRMYLEAQESKSDSDEP